MNCQIDNEVPRFEVKEGAIKKGGYNQKPTTKRPNPPKGMVSSTTVPKQSTEQSGSSESSDSDI